MRLKPRNLQEKHLIEVVYLQLCSNHYLIPPIAVALLVGAGGIFAVGLATSNLSDQFEIASTIFVSFGLIFLYYDALYIFRKMRKYEEVLGIRKVLKKFTLPPS